MIFVSALCALGMWLYLQRIVIPHQTADAALHGRPRGNLSDLYPRWLGARELLLRGRDPYSVDITREIQTGYYGRPLDPSRSEDPKDEQRFAYPVYVAFILGPTIGLPFAIVQKSFFWIFLCLTAASVPLWLRVMHWRPPWQTQVSLILLTAASPAVAQALKLRQLSLLVAALVVVAVLLITSNRLSLAGIVLALATIKPQLVWLLLVWLAVWIFSDWKRRSRLAFSFLITMTVLETASEMWLPNWIPRFWQAIHDYQRYTGAASVIDKMVSPSVGTAASLLSLAMAGIIFWNERRKEPSSKEFVSVVGMVLAVTVLVAPTFAPYNQILLLAAMLQLVRDWREVWRRGIASRLLMTLAAAVTAWPWITAALLSALSFVLPAETAQRFWTVPFWTVWLIPVSVSAVMLVMAHRAAFDRSERRIPA